MFVAKPHKAGEAVQLDGADRQLGIENLATDPGAALLQAIDFGLYGNPDGASASIDGKPNLMGPVKGMSRPGNVSGRGMIQKTAQTTAPMSNPFPRPSSSVKTSPSSIAK